MTTPTDAGDGGRPVDRPAFAVLPKNDPFAAANALRVLAGVEPLPHETQTRPGGGEQPGRTWHAECTCGYRGPDRSTEERADMDRRGHDEPNKTTSS